MKDYLLIFLMYMVCSYEVCPNNCSGHGKCVGSSCFCFIDNESGDSYSGNDCSYHNCAKGNPFAAVNKRVGSSSKDVSGGGNNRELNVKEELEKNNKERKLGVEGEGVSVSLIGEKSIDGDNKLWKVGGLQSLTSEMPKSGGIILCDFLKVDENAESEKEIDIRGFTDEYAYAYFSDGVTSINGNPSVNQKGDYDYSKVLCKSIKSKRENLFRYNLKSEINVPTPAPRSLRERQLFNNSRKLAGEDNNNKMTWIGYGEILYDMGLLPIKEQQQSVVHGGRGMMEGESKIVYKNENFKFGCFKKETNSPYVSTKTEIIIVDGVKGEYDTSNTDKSVVFDFSGKNLDSGTNLCYCLMDSNGKTIDITKTDLKDNIRIKDNKYYFGKYEIVETDSTIADVVENDHIVIKTKGFTAEQQVNGIDNYKKKDYLYTGRVVYLTLLDETDYSFKEKRVEMAASFAIPTIDNYILFPYIRTYPIDPSSKLPTPVISETMSTGSSPYVYRVVYFADNTISGLTAAGGVIKCLKNKETELINVKGVLKYGNDPIYSLIESESEIKDDGLISLNCYGIDTKRQDFSLTNPSTLTNPTSSSKITWKGYSGILPTISNPTDVSFACYLPSDLNKEFKIVGISEISNPSGNNKDVEFTLNNGEPNKLSADSSYTCYLLADLKGNKIEDIGKSDLISLVRKGTGNDNNYYFGKFEVSEEVKIQKADDGSEVIPLDGTENTIENEKITLNNEKIVNENKDEIMNKLKPGNKFHLKLYKENIPSIEKFQEITIEKVEIKTETPSRRLLNTITTVISYTPGIESGFKSDNVLYTSPPVKRITVNPVGDENNHLYKLLNFNRKIVNELPSIGGKIQCKIVKSEVESGEIKSKTEFSSNVDVKGIINQVNNDINGYYQFDVEIEESNSKDGDHYYVDNIVCNRILSKRKDLTYWNPTTIPEDFDKVMTWSGYGSIASDIGITFEGNKARMACYNPKDDKNKLISFYDVETSIITKVATDLIFTFSDKNKKPSEGNICYLLSDKNGKIIEIANGELSSSISVDGLGNYYYGEYIDENKKEENENNVIIKGGMSYTMNADGSVKSRINKNDIIMPGGDSSDTDNIKLDLSKSNNENNPIILIPPSMIDISIQKVITSGTFVRIIIHYDNGEKYEIPTQILKVGKSESNNKFILTLSDSIPLTPGGSRLRLLPTVNQINSIELLWSNEGSTHIGIECSGQGICDGNSGLCKCFSGFSGSSCERIDCPNNCNGNGRCVSLSELLSNSELINNYEGFGNKHVDDGSSVVFNDQVYGCLCDKRHRGYDCSLIECPSGVDPEGVSNDSGLEYRDCSGRGICNYESGICECFEGYNGEGCQIMVQTI